MAVSEDGRYAAVTLQENSAVAFIDLTTGRLTVRGLGAKDHSLPGNGLDPSDDDGGINIGNWPVMGLYQPDGIDSFVVDGELYWVIANEGDVRDGFAETERLADAVEDGLVVLDPTVFGDEAAIAALLDDSALGRLEIFVNEGDTDGDGDLDIIYVPGARSFSVLDAAGNMIFDSGDQFEQITAELLPDFFNANNDENDSFDNRSDNKGPEPEGIVTGTVGGVPYAFIGLERIGGVMVYDLTDPTAPRFVQYINSRDFTAEDGTLAAGDLGPEGLAFIPAEDSPTGKAMIAVAHEISGTTAIYEFDAPFRLQLLHTGDLEGGTQTGDYAPFMAAIVDRLEDSYANTLLISAGDNIIPGPFYNAAGDASFTPALQAAYEELFGLPAGSLPGLLTREGAADIAIMNVMGFDASVLGNHELDAGTNAFGGLIGASSSNIGTLFPYLSANLDFSGDVNLATRFTSLIARSDQYVTAGPNRPLDAIAQKLAPATTVVVGGETIGVVGATTQLLEIITSAGGIQVLGGVDDRDDMEVLAAVLQPTIDALRNQGVDKIILTTQLQQIANEKQLATLLDGVDIIIAGGSNTIQAEADDRLLPGDVADEGYPFVAQSASGETVLVVSTDGDYKYLGQLVVDFDSNGEIILSSLDDALIGPIAADQESVDALWGNEDAFAEGTKGNIVRDITTAVDEIIAVQDGNPFGETDVFLEGRRDFVRTEETNLGNLTADANLAYAQQVDPTVQASLKNGGGIRFQIGSIGDGGELLPTEANPDAGKEAGEISQLDIANSLRFNNTLTLVTLTTEQLLAALENGVSLSGPGQTQGRFPQVSGIAFSWDPDGVAGDRIQSLAIVDEDGGLVKALVDNGEVVADAAGDLIRIVTLGFLVDGGDGYGTSLGAGTDRVNLIQTGVRDGEATFADTGSEQDALAEYLASEFPIDGPDAYGEPETPAADDFRIQNLNIVANDTIDDLFI